MIQSILSAMSEHGWVPGIGDPTVYGWTAVAGYLAVAVVGWLAARTARGDVIGRLFWLIISIAFLALAINKQLDLQSWFTQTGKRIAHEQGWYDQRKIVQQWFIAGVGMAGLVVLIVTGLMLRRRAWPYWLTFLGLVCTVGFVMIRASSFHHVDILLGRRLAFIPFNFIFEISAILLTGLGAFWHLRAQRQSH